jgi:hypothetical protein
MKKRHHTISRCYLRNFSDKDGFLWVLDTKDNIFKVKPENILVENHFYTITLKNGEESPIIEDALANIEGTYAAIFENKISKDKFLTDDERTKVAIFIAALYLRTKPQREGMRRMFQKLKGDMEDWKKQFEMNPKAREFASAIPSSGETISLSDIGQYLNDFEEYHSVSIIDNLPYVAQLIFNMKWSVWRNQNCNFVTCDNPLVLLRPASIKKYGPKAFGSLPGLVYKDVELTLPLAKDRLLLAGWILEQDSYIDVDDEMARKINHRTITHSSERVIADSKDKVNAIKERYTETAYKNSAKTMKI